MVEVGATTGLPKLMEGEIIQETSGNDFLNK